LKIPQPQPDKIKHFFWGDVVSVAGHAAEMLVRHFGLDLPRGVLGMAFCAAVALGREAWNKRNGGRWSWADVGWTMGGGASTSGLYALGAAP
jgi:uncharacterized protein YfiM (DUF2279 family)